MKSHVAHAICSVRQVCRSRIKVGRQFALANLHEIADQSLNSKEFLRAEVAYKLMLRLEADNPDASGGLRDLFIEQQRLGDAVDLEYASIRGTANDFFRFIDLVKLHLRLQQDVEAVHCLEAAIALDRDSHAVDYAMGCLRRYENKLDEAVGYYRTCLSKTPRYTPAVLDLATTLIDCNLQADAICLLEDFYENCPELFDRYAPESFDVYFTLASIHYYASLSHPHILRLTGWLADKTRRNRRCSIVAHFTLAQLHDFLGFHDRAFLHFQAGNDLLHDRFDIAPWRKGTAQRIYTYSREVIAQKAKLGSEPLGSQLVFIVGMPRSGSTLVEQILASHPAVIARGERAELPNLVCELPGILGAREPYPGCIAGIKTEQLDLLRVRYIEHVTRGVENSALYVDKMLENYRELGLILILFPNSRIIHCRRDPLDTCLSCYFQNFQGIAWAHNLQTIASVYTAYKKLMAHWRRVCPRPFLEVDYEEVVSDPESSIRKLLDYCGLAWHPGCLEFHRARRNSCTASFYQVKLPLYKTSVRRWRNYEHHLGDLRRMLGC